MPGRRLAQLGHSLSVAAITASARKILWVGQAVSARSAIEAREDLQITRELREYLVPDQEEKHRMSSHGGSTRRIVVGIDGSPSSLAALEWAARQAEFTGSALEVMIVWQWPMSYGFAMPLASDFDPATEAGKVLDGAIADARKAHPEVEIRPSIIEGFPAQVLVEASKDAELVVVGSRGHGEFAGLLIGSVSEHCVTHAHCPVLVLRQ
jgi:nucleotide-binding universal stress UspA family protein